MTVLHELFERAATRWPERIAVEDPAASPGADSITYRELAGLSDRVRDRISAVGVQPGDRVGVYLRKSTDSVATILGILKAGATYVPVDPGAPPSRNAYILDNCSVRLAIVERRSEAALRAELASLRAAGLPLLAIDDVGGGHALRAALDAADAASPAAPVRTVQPANDALAYILYTSGSTGRPKGVMLSHENAVTFVDWCAAVFRPTERDRFSSHAPFHFDLSVLDLYLALGHGATLVLIGEELGKEPLRLAPFIEERRITVWYSAPSILSMLAQHGDLERRDYSALRLVLFAGEVFAVKHLRALHRLVPHPRYFNLYGPTETNVCTYHEIPTPIPDDRTEPFPIGKVCDHLRTRVIGGDDQAVAVGEEGELQVAGPGVMQGYWGLPELTAAAFAVDGEGTRWYHTGDVVIEQPDGAYRFLGRRDRMVKRRGYLVELGEIEVALYRHPAVKEAAVIALPDPDAGIRVKAFVSLREGVRPSIIEMKRFCADALPLYMVPDLFSFRPSLPKTSTDKIDYQGLKGLD